MRRTAFPWFIVALVAGCGGQARSVQDSPSAADAGDAGASDAQLDPTDVLDDAPMAEPHEAGPIGAPCQYRNDCVWGAGCDPNSGKCAPACSRGGMPGSVPCATGQTCVPQDPLEAEMGACFDLCSDQSPCSAGFVCSASSHGAGGVCIRGGTVGPGEPCAASEITSPCVQGYLCTQDGCQPPCDRYAQEPGCPAGLVCSGFSICARSPPGDPAAIGERCRGDEVACGNDGKAWRGLCDGSLICRKICETDQDCPSNETCSPSVGACYPAA